MRRPGVLEHALLVGDLLAVELQAHERRSTPGRRRRGRPSIRGTHRLIEGHAGRRDHRRPLVDRVLEARRVGFAAADRRAAIVHAERDDRPAVVLAGLGDVQLVAAARAVLDLPELAGLRDSSPRPGCCGGRRTRSPAARRPGRRTGCPPAPRRPDGCGRSCRDASRAPAPGRGTAPRSARRASTKRCAFRRRPAASRNACCSSTFGCCEKMTSTSVSAGASPSLSWPRATAVEFVPPSPGSEKLR